MCIKKDFMSTSKETVYPKTLPKICPKISHPQAIQDVDDFVLLLEQILGNLALFSSEWVPSQWDFKQQIKTSQ